MADFSFEDFLSWADPTGPGTSGDPEFSGEDSGVPSWLSSIFSALQTVGGPAATTIGSLLNANRATGAAQTAGQQESSALNRGIDLQTAQWLQQQQNLAPYMQAGREGVQGLQDLLKRDMPALPGATPAIGKPDYFPGQTPGWTPQNYQAQVPVPDPNAYMWRPGQGPSAQDYRYTPGQTPGAQDYRYTPGAVPTLSGQALLANDPGVAFRLAEGRKALEGSAAARGELLSGSTLAALQRQGQELSSQEYGQAWNRASQQAQMREGWAQQASQMGWGQAESAARLREQVNQVASQQGWSQAQAEAAFREGMAQQSSQQGYAQALAGQQANFTQGLDASKWNQQQQEQYASQLYNRQLEQAKLRYGIETSQNETDYARQQNLYRQQLSQHLLPWEQQSTLANLGGQAVSQAGVQGQRSVSGISELLARLGQTQAQSTATSALAQNTATNTATNSLASVLSRLNA